MNIRGGILRALATVLMTSAILAASGPQEVKCLRKGPIGLCRKCPPNAYMKAGRCYLQDVPGCLEYYSNRNKCRVYMKKVRAARKLIQILPTPSGGGAVPGTITYTVKDCQYKDSLKDACITCNKGFFQQGGKCSKQDITDCDTYTDNVNQCKSCKNGLVVRNNMCVNGDPLCEVWESAQVCKRCVSLYYPLQCGTCDQITARKSCKKSSGLENKCQDCGEKTYLTDQGDCKTQDLEFCTNYAENKNYCVKCIDGYLAKNGLCQIVLEGCDEPAADNKKCKICSAGYKEVNGVCNKLNDGCKRYDNFGCVECYPGFRPWNGGCAKDFEINCYQYIKETNRCGQCKKLFFGPDCGCHSVDIEFCDDSNGFTKYCTRCQKGYYAVFGLECKKQDVEGCADYKDNENWCNKCGLGYVEKGNGQCKLDITDCLQYDNEKPGCKICAKNQIPDPEKNNLACKPVTVEPCVDSKGNPRNCDFCEPGYVKISETVCEPHKIPGCKLNVQNLRVCKECLENYNKDSNNNCIKKIDNCESPSSDFQTCNKCLKFFYRNNGGKTCDSIDDKNCDYSEGLLKSCKTCKGGNYPLNGVCTTQDVPGCHKHVDNENQCQTCKDTHNGPLNGLCVPKKDHCSQYTIDYKWCTFCDDGWWANNGNCDSQNVPGCKKHWPNQNSCEICKDTHVPDGLGNCLPKIDNCDKYSDDKKSCVSCVKDWWANSGRCDEQKIDGCESFTDNKNWCEKCGSNYYQPLNGKCIPKTEDCEQLGNNPAGCARCTPNYYKAGPGSCLKKDREGCATTVDQENKCSSCQKGYTGPVNGICTPQIDNCLIPSNVAGLCEKCVKDWYAEAGKCKKQDIEGCINYTENKNYCVECGKDFYDPVNGLCRPIKLPCLKLDPLNANRCAKCDTGHYLEDGVCQRQVMDGCARFVPEQKFCDQCNESIHYLVGGICYPNPEFCKKPSPTAGGVCEICQNGYIPKNGKCSEAKNPNCKDFVENSGDCSVCEKYYFVTKTKRCNLEVEFCEKYNDGEDECVKCKSLFYPTVKGRKCASIEVSNCEKSEGKIKECGNCIDGLEKIDGECTKKIEGCLAYWKSNQGCRKCDGEKYWGPKFGNCFEKIKNCKTPDESDYKKCKECEENYYEPIDNKCYEKIKNCDVPDGKGGCQKCSSGFYDPPVNGKCHPTIPHCDLPSLDQTSCELCHKSFYYESGSCIPRNNPGCAEFIKNSNLCDICSNGYTKNPFGICILPPAPTPIQNCAQVCTSTGLCTACSNLFYLPTNPGNSCLPISIKFCKTSNGVTNDCTTCDSGRFKTTDANGNTVCQLRNVVGCDKYLENSNTCFKCFSQYLLYQGVCVNPVNNCVAYSKKTLLCTFCKLPWVLAANTNICQRPVAPPTPVPPKIPNCVTIHENNRCCKKCRPLFYLSADGLTCLPISEPNCDLSDGCNNSCSRCKPDYDDDNDNDDKNTPFCRPKVIVGCLKYHPNGKGCNKCHPNFKQYKHICVPIVNNCADYRISTGRCRTCDDYYTLKGGSCTKIKVPNCVSSEDSDSACSVCEDGCYLKPNKTCEKQKLTGCKVFKKNENSCVQCHNGNSPVKGLCVN